MEDDKRLVRQDRLDKTYKTILAAIVFVTAIAVIATFAQIYSINSKINSEVEQIQAAQKKNRGISDNQNGIILGYLICIGNIQPPNRTPDIINNCVAQAQKSDTQLSR